MKTLGIFVVTLAGLSSAACGGSSQPAQKPAQDVTTLQGYKVDDQSRCDFRGRADRDARETSSTGSIVPNVRRVYGFVGTGDARQKVLLCREVDTNLDGAKDLVRVYDDKGEKLNEQADANYDGRIDTWITFATGRVNKIELDRNADGKVDETRYYAGGRVTRIQRDTNADGKADVFEVYEGGRLERMGTDADHDGRVDRWDRDEVRAHDDAMREARELEEKKKQEEAQQKAAEAEAAEAEAADKKK